MGAGCASDCRFHEEVPGGSLCSDRKYASVFCQHTEELPQSAAELLTREVAAKSPSNVVTPTAKSSQDSGESEIERIKSAAKEKAICADDTSTANSFEIVADSKRIEPQTAANGGPRPKKNISFAPERLSDPPLHFESCSSSARPTTAEAGKQEITQLRLDKLGEHNDGGEVVSNGAQSPDKLTESQASSTFVGKTISLTSRVSKTRMSLLQRLRSKTDTTNGEVDPSTRLKKLTSSNTNGPQDYAWLEEVLQTLVRNEAGSLGCVDTATGKGFTPIFFVIGACPNIFAGMQAVMYSVDRDRTVDFWWVKPSKGTIDRTTLSRHAKGPHKNDPGRSKPFYKPIGDLFAMAQTNGGLRFGIEDPSTTDRSPRAYVEQESRGKFERMFLHLVWQEDWTNNPFARTKYVKGKIVYQRNPEANEFFARQYSIYNGVMDIFDYEEKSNSVLPGDEIKSLWDWVPEQKSS